MYVKFISWSPKAPTLRDRFISKQQSLFLKKNGWTHLQCKLSPGTVIHTMTSTELFVYFISTEYVLKPPTLLLASNITIFLNINFYFLFWCGNRTCNIKWAAETEFTSELSTKARQGKAPFQNSTCYKQEIVPIPYKIYFQ